jgi:hypothetical protein
LGNRICDLIPKHKAIFFAYSTTIADSISDYLKEKNISKEDLAGFFGISIEKVNKMLSGHYDFDLMEIVKVEFLLNNHYLVYQKELIIEKKHHY